MATSISQHPTATAAGVQRASARKQTLLRVAEYVCAVQEAYIRGDARGLRPQTRSEVANALGVHESTCSRAVAGKLIFFPEP